MKKTTLALAALAASFICAAAGAETRSADIRLEKPLLSAHLSFSGNIRRFDVKLEKPMDLSSAAGVSFQVKCADPQVLTDCWLLFRTGHGYLSYQEFLITRIIRKLLLSGKSVSHLRASEEATRV